MSNGFRWELSEWGDGTKRLAYWDSMAGQDVIIILNADSTADLSSYDEQEQEQRTPINLTEYLLKWLADN